MSSLRLSEACDYWRKVLECLFRSSQRTMQRFLEIHEAFVSSPLLLCILLECLETFPKDHKFMSVRLFDCIFDHSSYPFNKEEKKKYKEKIREFFPPTLQLGNVSHSKNERIFISPRAMIPKGSMLSSRSRRRILTRTRSQSLNVSLGFASSAGCNATLLKCSHEVFCREHIDSYQITSALTSIDKNLLRRFRSSDLDEEKREKVWMDKIIRQQDNLKIYIQKEILSSGNPKKLILHCIRICKHLKTQKNYQSLLTFVSALDSLPRDLWKAVPITKIKFFKKMSAIFDPQKSYANYREYIQDCIPHIPCIPIVFRDAYMFLHYSKLYDKNPQGKYSVNKDLLKGLHRINYHIKHAQHILFLGKVSEELENKLSHH